MTVNESKAWVDWNQLCIDLEYAKISNEPTLTIECKISKIEFQNKSFLVEKLKDAPECIKNTHKHLFS